MALHADELPVSTAMVRRLVDDQFARWRGLRLVRLPVVGTVNALFRLGDGLVVRLALQAGDPDEVRRRLAAEAAAAAELVTCAPVPTPEPVALGEPGAGYPLPWSVQTWVPGVPASEDDPGASEGFAADLARLIMALRRADTRGRRFSGAGRGGDLHDHEEWVQTCLARSQGLLDVRSLRRRWEQCRELPRVGADVMSHTDLIPANVLVRDGRLAGLIDVGGFGPADPALDIVAAWHLLEDGPRRVLRDELGCDDLEWERGRAWAFEQAIGLVWYYRDSLPALSAMGRRTLDRLLAG